jgi:nucleoside phosphorylase
VDNLDYRESLKSLFPEAIGGEMEGVGLYVSACAAKVDWIVIKAICDWGHHKNHAEKDAWQQLAAANSVRVLKAALDLGGLYDDLPILPPLANSETRTGK